MDYLISVGWPLWILAYLVGVVAADSAVYHWEKHNLPEAERFHVQKPKPPEFLEDDELFVISNDTDEVIFSGTPGAVYDWLEIYQGMSSLDIFNVGTSKKVRASQFKSKYIEQEA